MRGLYSVTALTREGVRERERERERKGEKERDRKREGEVLVDDQQPRIHLAFRV